MVQSSSLRCHFLQSNQETNENQLAIKYLGFQTSCSSRSVSMRGVHGVVPGDGLRLAEADFGRPSAINAQSLEGELELGINTDCSSRGVAINVLSAF